MITSSIQAAANYIYYPINQKISQVVEKADWKEKTMLAGLIISVCCAVITFFTQTAFICTAFSLLSGICSLGTLYVRHYESLKKMQECVEDLETENQRFSLSNQVLEDSVIEQKNTVILLTSENETLKAEVNKITIHTTCLEKTSQDLLHSLEDLRVHLVAIKPIATGSQEAEKKLSAFSITMGKQQAVSQNLMELISKVSAEQASHLEGGKAIIQQLLSLQNNDTTLQKIKELNHLREQISYSHDQLAGVLEKAAQASTQLSNLQVQYGLENTRLQETRQELSKVSCELQTIRSDLQAVLSEYKALLAEQKGDKSSLASQVDRLEKIYANLHHSDRNNGLH